jgi:hypothetical protein
MLNLVEQNKLLVDFLMIYIVQLIIDVHPIHVDEYNLIFPPIIFFQSNDEF